MSTYFLTDAGDRIISDDTFGIVSDPTEIFRDSATCADIARDVRADGSFGAEWYTPRASITSSPFEILRLSLADTFEVSGMLGGVSGPAISHLDLSFSVVSPALFAAEECLSTEGMDASHPVEVCGSVAKISVPASGSVGTIAPLSEVPIHIYGSYISLTDYRAPIEILSTVATPLTGYGFQLDPDGSRLSFDGNGGGGLLTDPQGDLMVLENSVDVRMTVVPQLGLGSSILRDFPFYATPGDDLFVDTSSRSPLEILGAVATGPSNAFRVSGGGLGGFFLTDDGFRLIQDAAGLQPMEVTQTAGTSDVFAPAEFLLAALGDAAGQIEILNIAFVDTFDVIEITRSVTRDDIVPLESAGRLQREMPTELESLTSILQLTFALLERTRDVGEYTPVPHESAGTLAVRTPVEMDALGIFMRDDDVPVEETLGVPVASTAPLEKTFDVKPLAPVPLEKTIEVRNLFAIPIQFTTILLVERPSPVEIKGVLLAHTPGLVEHVLQIRSDTPTRAERLGGVNRLTPLPSDSGTRLQTDVIPSVELVVAQHPSDHGVPEASDSNLRGELIPAQAEFVGGLQLDRLVAALDFHLGLANVSKVAHELVGQARLDTPLGAEHIVTVSGLTPGAASYRGTLGGSHSTVAEIGMAVTASVAAALERLVDVTKSAPSPDEWRGTLGREAPAPVEEVLDVPISARSQVETVGVAASRTPAPAEWRGALQIDLPMRAERLAALLEGSPAVLEITMTVKPDSAVPIAFYGYALIQQPTLQGSKVKVDLKGSKVEIDLGGSKPSIVLVGSIKR